MTADLAARVRTILPAALDVDVNARGQASITMPSPEAARAAVRALRAEVFCASTSGDARVFAYPRRTDVRAVPATDADIGAAYMQCVCGCARRFPGLRAAADMGWRSAWRTVGGRFARTWTCPWCVASQATKPKREERRIEVPASFLYEAGMGIRRGDVSEGEKLLRALAAADPEMARAYAAALVRSWEDVAANRRERRAVKRWQEIAAELGVPGAGKRTRRRAA